MTHVHFILLIFGEAETLIWAVDMSMRDEVKIIWFMLRYFNTLRIEIIVLLLVQIVGAFIVH